MPGNWNEADANPLADIQRFREEVYGQERFKPTHIVISSRVYYRIVRGTMTKRQFRRWRGKNMAWHKSYIRSQGWRIV